MRPRLFSVLPLALSITPAACNAPSQPGDAQDSRRARSAVAGAAGDPPADPSPANAAVSPEQAAAATPARATLSCAADIGAAAAAQLARSCRKVSPATRPPCNVANSCAMIQDEIARSCALFDGEGPAMAGCGPDPKGPVAAAQVVERYYAALNARDYQTAWSQWGEGGPRGQPLDRFSAGFSHTRSTRVTIGTLPPGEGAAGSIYQTVPVAVEAVLDSGRRQRFTGSYVMRRVNDVDGATPAQRRWHIDSATLRPAG